MSFLLWTMLAYGGDACETISLSDIAAVPAPAIIVLGERRGAQPDPYRARRVLKRLQRDDQNPVMLATDIVHHKFQNALTQFERGDSDLKTLETGLAWQEHSATSFSPYGQLFKLAESGVKLRAVGSDLNGPPEKMTPPVPAVYTSLISSAIPENDLVALVASGP